MAYTVCQFCRTGWFPGRRISISGVQCVRLASAETVRDLLLPAETVVLGK